MHEKNEKNIQRTLYAGGAQEIGASLECGEGMLLRHQFQWL